MTTLATDTYRVLEGGDRNEFPVIASDIIYEGAAVGLVPASGHARPLQAGDLFVGFAEQKADNSAGAAAAINVRVIEQGKAQLAVSGAVITDVGNPVYATDDNAFTFNPVSGVFIGYMHRFISAGVAIVRFDANEIDPFHEYSYRETISGATKTLDAQDTGKLFYVTVDSVITLPSIADGYAGGMIICGGAYGTVQISIDPAAADMVLGPDITGADNKDIINTKATAKRGDLVKLDLGDADGYVITQLKGTWAREA